MKFHSSRVLITGCLCLGVFLSSILACRATDPLATILAVKIAEDSGRPTADFNGYAARLAKTLRRMDSSAIKRVLGGNTANSVGLGQGNSSANSTTGGSGGGTTTDPATHEALTQEVVDALNADVPPSDSTLKALLLEASPLSTEILERVLTDSTLQSSSLKAVLIDNIPLDSAVFEAMILGGGNLTESHRTAVIQAQVGYYGSTNPDGTTTP